MIVAVVGVVVPVRMGMSRAVRVQVLVLVEDDVQMAPEGIGDAAQGLEAGHMLAALEPRDHRFRHAETFRQLFLRLARAGAQVEQAMSTARGDFGAVIAGKPTGPALGRYFHLTGT